jgi:hypothetical protein
MQRITTALLALGAIVLLLLGCGSSKSAAAVPPCDQACKDGIALRSIRETMKLAFNLTLQGKPVGHHDETASCPLGGKARVFGDATSNAVQGATEVKLTYVLDQCQYLQKDTDPTQSYHMTLTGTLAETGTLAVQPSATNAIEISSDTVSITGTVHDPPLDYKEDACAIKVGQNGNRLSGTFCARIVGLTL